MRPATAFALLAMLAAQPVRADSSDTQLWTQVTVIAPLAKSVTATLDVSPRFREAASGGDQVLSRFSIDGKLNQVVSVGAGIVYADADGPHEIRPHQQVVLDFGWISLRTRLEERFFAGNDRMGVRLRERITAKQTIDRNDKLLAAAEGIFTLRSATIGGQTGFEQLRLILADEHAFSKKLSLTAGYMVMVTPKRGKPTLISHVPLVTLTWRP